MATSRAQAKIQSLGLESLSANSIRRTVRQGQPRKDEILRLFSKDRQIILALELKREHTNTTLLIEDLEEFQLDLTHILNDGEEIYSIVLRSCTNFHIGASACSLIIPKFWDRNYLLLLDHCNDFLLKDLHVKGCRNPISLNDCGRFRIERIIVEQARGYGLTLLRSQSGTVCDSSFLACVASGINIVGQCRDLYIQKCRITGSIGPYNLYAVINFMHCSPAVTIQDVAETTLEALDLRDKLDTQHRVWIEACKISHCHAQGIYIEGVAQLLIKDCLIHDNNKEGICFDWGTAFSHLRHCQLVRNGERAHYHEPIFAIDFLPVQFCDREGRHYCRLPGVSIDNGYANAIEHNLVSANYGEGIKMVRSGFDNQIQFNTLGGNVNKLVLAACAGPSNSVFQPSECSLLNKGLGDQQEFHLERAFLDFLPPRGNRIRDNQVLAVGGGRNLIINCWDSVRTIRDDLVKI